MFFAPRTYNHENNVKLTRIKRSLTFCPFDHRLVSRVSPVHTLHMCHKYEWYIEEMMEEFTWQNSHIHHIVDLSKKGIANGISPGWTYPKRHTQTVPYTILDRCKCILRDRSMMRREQRFCQWIILPCVITVRPRIRIAVARRLFTDLIFVLIPNRFVRPIYSGEQ